MTLVRVILIGRRGASWNTVPRMVTGSDNRARIRRLIKLASERKVNRVGGEHKDRLSRFMAGVFGDFFDRHGVTVAWIDESLPQIL